MAKAGRKRKVDAVRYPNGDIKPTHDISPITIKRLMMAAAARMASEEWGTVLGRYFLTGQISEEQYRAGRNFGALCESHAKAIGGPKSPNGSSVEKFKSQEMDVDSFMGEEESKRHILIIERYEKAKSVIGHKEDFENVKLICEGLGQLPENYEKFLSCRHFLTILARHWKIK